MTSQQNIQALLAKGVSQAFIDKELAKGKKGLAKGSNIDDKDVASFVSAWDKSPDKMNAQYLSAVPDFLKNDPSFQNLSDDLKAIAVYNYQVQTANNTQKIEALNSALEQATAQADPYWKNIIRIAQTEVTNGLADIQGDFQSQNENLKKQIQYIQEDLATNRGNMTLEEQSTLASLAADLNDRQKVFELNMQQLGAQKASQLDSLQLDFQKSIDDINRNTTFTQEEKATALEKINQNFVENRGVLIGSAADAGLTFSTKRKIAEQRLARDNEGLVESTTRQYNKSLADLGASAQYATAQNTLQTGNINQNYQFSAEQQRQAQETAQRQVQEERDRVQREYAKQIAALETDASRGNTTAQAQMADLQRKLQASLASAGLAAEKYLGTENLPTGVQGIGGVPGQVYEDKTKDIAQRQDAIYGDLTQRSLNYAPIA